MERLVDVEMMVTVLVSCCVLVEVTVTVDSAFAIKRILMLVFQIDWLTFDVKKAVSSGASEPILHVTVIEFILERVLYYLVFYL